MTDPRDFRDELGNLPPDLALGATAEHLMRRGRRIRLTRQGLVAGTAAVAVVGITTVVSLSVHHGPQTVHAASGGGLGGLVGAPSSASPVPASSSPAPVWAPATSAPPAPASSAWPMASSASAPASAWPATSSAATCTPPPQPELGAPAATSDGNPAAWGTVIPVGTDSGKSVALYGVHISDPEIPCTHFGLMLGTTATSGVTGVYEANEFDGSDIEPGFHAVSSASGVSQLAGWDYFGYYVGAAVSISVEERQHAAPVAATVVAWSVNPNVKIWWVSGTGAAPTFGAVSAKDAAGNALPTGNHAQLGVG